MSFWLKIGIEIVLALLVMFCGYGFWLFSRLPYIFDTVLSSAESVAWSMKLARTSGKREETKVVEDLDALDTGGFTVQAKYQMYLFSCYFGALKVWKIEKWVFLTFLLMILIGSFFLYWPAGLVNVSIFLLLGYSSDSPLAVKDVASQVSLIAEVVQLWLNVDSKGCKRFCAGTPMFSAVYRLVSKKDASSRNLFVLGREQWQKTSAK